MSEIRDSFTAADGFPVKLLQANAVDGYGHIRPLHLQLIPTNVCGVGCPWCSCRDEDRTQELEYQEICEILHRFSLLGMRAVTITGGGEPCAHERLEDIVSSCVKLGGVGLVTNGVLWRAGKRLNAELTWARVSIVKDTLDYAVRVCRELPDVDVGISLTITDTPNIDLAMEVCGFAEASGNVTHVRFVQDIVGLPNSFEEVVGTCAGITEKAIFQCREHFTSGARRCLISLLKPVVGADGFVYPCCGAQYALGDGVRKMPLKMQMCHWTEFPPEGCFNGTVCNRCYYHRYNEMLDYMTRKVAHPDFV